MVRMIYNCCSIRYTLKPILVIEHLICYGHLDISLSKMCLHVLHMYKQAKKILSGYFVAQIIQH